MERLAEEQRQKVGAFPSLSSQGTVPQAQAVPQAHKVLSLNAKTNKVTVASYNQPKPSVARKKAMLALNEEPEVVVRRVQYVKRCIPTDSSDSSRPWADANRGDRDLVYVRDALIDREETSCSRKERKGGARGRVDRTSDDG